MGACVVSLLTDDAWLTMPPEPHEYQGHAAIATFLDNRAPLLGGHLRLVATRANGQPAFGCSLPDAQAEIVRGYGLSVLTLGDDHISAACSLTRASTNAPSSRDALSRAVASHHGHGMTTRPPPMTVIARAGLPSGRGMAEVP